jgi:hypothetical protein
MQGPFRGSALPPQRHFCTDNSALASMPSPVGTLAWKLPARDFFVKVCKMDAMHREPEQHPSTLMTYYTYYT